MATQTADQILSLLGTFNKQWTLYCMDRNSRWHLYDLIEPSADFDDMLIALDRDPTGIFWG
jgi:hypothetical protein